MEDPPVLRNDLMLNDKNRVLVCMPFQFSITEPTLTGPALPKSFVTVGGIADEDEEANLMALNDWIEAQGLPRGQMVYDYTDPDTGEQRAVFDLAWPEGLQEGLTPPIAVLLNEGAERLELANSAGFRCFTAVLAFKSYVAKEIFSQEMA